MSEMGDFYRELKEENREKRIGQLAARVNEIIKWCNDNEVQCCGITSYQLRVTDMGRKVDIYPLSFKYHDIGENIRGKIKFKLSIKEWLEKEFGND